MTTKNSSKDHTIFKSMPKDNLFVKIRNNLKNFAVKSILVQVNKQHNKRISIKDPNMVVKINSYPSFQIHAIVMSGVLGKDMANGVDIELPWSKVDTDSLVVITRFLYVDME